MKNIIVLLFAFALAAMALPQGIITDGDANFEFNVSATAGSANFEPDSTTDHLFQNYWWYRINGLSTNETAFAFPADNESYVGNVANLDWSIFAGGALAFRALLNIELTDGGSPGEALVVEEMTILNTLSTPLSISIFNYADFDVSGTFGGDSAPVIAGDTMTITDGTTGDFAQFQGVGANAYQVTPFATLRTLLNDANIDNLNNTGLPFGPGDFTGGFQWDLTLAPGGSTTVTERLSVNMPVPEPASMLVLGGALAALAARRRRKLV